MDIYEKVARKVIELNHGLPYAMAIMKESGGYFRILAKDMDKFPLAILNYTYIDEGEKVNCCYHPSSITLSKIIQAFKNNGNTLYISCFPDFTQNKIKIERDNYSLDWELTKDNAECTLFDQTIETATGLGRLLFDEK